MREEIELNWKDLIDSINARTLNDNQIKLVKNSKNFNDCFKETLNFNYNFPMGKTKIKKKKFNNSKKNFFFFLDLFMEDFFLFSDVRRQLKLTKYNKQLFFPSPIILEKNKLPLLTDILERKKIFFYPICNIQSTDDKHVIYESMFSEDIDNKLELEYFVFLFKSFNVVSKFFIIFKNLQILIFS